MSVILVLGAQRVPGLVRGSSGWARTANGRVAALASAGRDRTLAAQPDQKCALGYDVAAALRGGPGGSSMVVPATGRRGTTRPGSPRREASRDALSRPCSARRGAGLRIDPNARKWC